LLLKPNFTLNDYGLEYACIPYTVHLLHGLSRYTLQYPLNILCVNTLYRLRDSLATHTKLHLGCNQDKNVIMLQYN